MRFIVLLLIGIFSYQVHSKTEHVYLSNTQVIYIQSKNNGIKYKLLLNLPKKYHNSNKRYPVIYLLDADYSFPLAKQIMEHLSDRNRIHDAILVGITYEDNEYKENRTRDYTPTHTATGGYGPEYQKYSGGAEKFYQFIQTELRPYIQKYYRTRPETTLTGHSFGGLFGAYLLLLHPESFDNYIIVSPSLWYDNQFLLNTLNKKSSLDASKTTKLELLIGEKENGGDYLMVNDIKKFNSLCLKKPHQNLIIDTKIIAEMDHDTVFPAAFTLAVMRLFGK